MAVIKVFGDYDFQKNKLLNVSFQQVTDANQDSVLTVPGQVAFNTDQDTLVFFDGTAVVPVGGGLGASDLQGVTDAGAQTTNTLDLKVLSGGDLVKRGAIRIGRPLTGKTIAIESILGDESNPSLYITDADFPGGNDIKHNAYEMAIRFTKDHDDFRFEDRHVIGISSQSGVRRRFDEFAAIRKSYARIGGVDATGVFAMYYDFFDFETSAQQSVKADRAFGRRIRINNRPGIHDINYTAGLFIDRDSTTGNIDNYSAWYEGSLRVDDRLILTNINALAALPVSRAALWIDPATGETFLYDFTPITSAERTKLAGLESPLFKGTYTNLSALQTAHPTADDGSYAYVDAGVGNPAEHYIWDFDDSSWIPSGSASGSDTPAVVKSKYESNPDTNAFTDLEKSKLFGVEAGAEVNVQADWTETSPTSDAYVANKPILYEPDYKGEIDLDSESEYPTTGLQKGNWWYVRNSVDANLRGFLSQPNPDVELFMSANDLLVKNTPEVGSFLFESGTPEVSIIPGKFGNAFEFNGGKKITYAYTAAGEKSIRIWVRSDFTVEDTTQAILSFGLSGSSVGTVTISRSSTTGNTRVSANASAYWGSMDHSFINTGNAWFHVEIKLDHVAQTGELLVDGVSVDNSTFSGFGGCDQIQMGTGGYQYPYELDGMTVVNNFNAFDFANDESPLQYTQDFCGDVLYYDPAYTPFGGFLKLQSKGGVPIHKHTSSDISDFTSAVNTLISSASFSDPTTYRDVQETLINGTFATGSFAKFDMGGAPVVEETEAALFNTSTSRLMKLEPDQTGKVVLSMQVDSRLATTGWCDFYLKAFDAGNVAVPAADRPIVPALFLRRDAEDLMNIVMEYYFPDGVEYFEIWHRAVVAFNFTQQRVIAYKY